jgi:predicted RNA-binding Zn ribbon-like protein
MTEGSWQRLKACGLDTCQWGFFDNSKNQSGHWCAMQVCGNKAKARAFRERRRSKSSRPRS